jgi:hypothetical protein
MSETVDDLTVNWEEGGELKVKELEKHVLTKGSWATLMFLFQEMDPKSKEYRAPKIGIRRYRKRGDKYVYQSKFNISSEKQAFEMVDVIKQWFADDGEGRKAADAAAEAKERAKEEAKAAED